LGAEQHVEVLARVDVKERVQERHLLAARREDSLEARFDEGARGARLDISVEERSERPRVPLGRLRRLPRRLERHLPGHTLEPPLRKADVEQAHEIEARNRASVAALLAPDDEEVMARGIGGKRLYPELLDEPEHPILRRTNPLPAEVDPRAARQDLGVGPPASAV